MSGHPPPQGPRVVSSGTVLSVLTLRTIANATLVLKSCEQISISPSLTAFNIASTALSYFQWCIVVSYDSYLFI